MESVRNPFFHRGPIRQRDCFFNRHHEVGQALGLLSSLQNVALIGQRRIGKTSLLFHLANPAIHADYGVPGQGHHGGDGNGDGRTIW